MKYKNQAIYIDNIRFDSRMEGDHYRLLRSEQKKGNLELLELQPKVYLTDAKILYKPDFLIKENDKLIYIDVKGFNTATFMIKKRLWKYYGAGILRIIYKDKIVEVKLLARSIP